MPIVNIDIKKINITKNLKKYYICDGCDIVYDVKQQLRKHIMNLSCKIGLTCSWCNIKFLNRGNLAQHAFHVHGDTSYRLHQSSDYNFKCNVCDKKFTQQWLLKYHIRQQHFNMIGKMPYCDVKKVNQVWFEKVQNTNNVIEIKKIGNNKLVMRKLGPNTAIKVMDHKTETIDVTDIYPVHRSKKTIMCTICNKKYVERDYPKHVREHHMNLVRHRCNNCNRTFKRIYSYLQHYCNKKKYIKGVKQCSKDLKIANVESLAILEPESIKDNN